MPERESVLVVDDDEALRELLVEQLRGLGYRVGSARGYFEALSSLHQEGYALVLSDVSMGPRDGFDLVAAVRRGPHPVPVVLMSCFCTEETEGYARDRGAAAFLAKPFEPEALETTLERVLHPERRSTHAAA